MTEVLDRVVAAKYGDLVNAVYEMFKGEPHNLTPTPKGFAPEWKHIAWIDMKDFFLGFVDPRFYGVVLQATEQNTTDFDYAIVIRGTEGATEWIDDAMAVPVPFSPVPNSGRVAYGFDRIYSTLNVTHAATGARLQIAEAAAPPLSFAQQINALVGAEPPPSRMPLADTGEPQGRFIVLGHSLGAALATLYVMENTSLKTVQHIDLLCTYASPRVGWAEFVNRFNALQSNGLTSWRITNLNDLVTWVPFKLLGYRDVDVGTEFSGALVAQNNPGCMHDMRTYQHWLDPAHYDAPDGCKIPAAMVSFVEAATPARTSIPDSAVDANPAEAVGAIRFTIDATVALSDLP